MAKLIYSCITSLDGFVADRDGSFDWSEPDEEVHRFVNDQERRVGTYLLGRRLYAVLVAWETWDTSGEPAVIGDYADIWRSTDKVVYSRTITDVSSQRTRLERRFDVEEVRQRKAETTSPVGVGGPELAGHALRAGLVDEIALLVSPVAVGGGTRFLPDDLRLDLRLLDERRFGNGVVHLRYEVRG